MKQVVISMFAILTFINIACNVAPNEPSPTPTTPIQSPPNDSGYPAPDNNEGGNSGYPAPSDDSIQEVDFSVPSYVQPQVASPKNGEGSVVGRTINSRDQSILFGMDLSIGIRTPLDPGPGHAITVMESSSPKGTSNNEGYFIIENLEPDEYSLVLVTPIGAKVITEQNSVIELTVEIIAEQITDLGDVWVEFP